MSRAKLPAKYFLAEILKFVGLGNPLSHLRNFINIICLKGIDKALFAQVFLFRRKGKWSVLFPSSTQGQDLGKFNRKILIIEFLQYGAAYYTL